MTTFAVVTGVIGAVNTFLVFNAIGIIPLIHFIFIYVSDFNISTSNALFYSILATGSSFFLIGNIRGKSCTQIHDQVRDEHNMDRRNGGDCFLPRWKPRARSSSKHVAKKIWCFRLEIVLIRIMTSPHHGLTPAKK